MAGLPRDWVSGPPAREGDAAAAAQALGGQGTSAAEAPEAGPCRRDSPSPREPQRLGLWTVSWDWPQVNTVGVRLAGFPRAVQPLQGDVPPRDPAALHWGTQGCRSKAALTSPRDHTCLLRSQHFCCLFAAVGDSPELFPSSVAVFCNRSCFCGGPERQGPHSPPSC